MQPQGTTNHWHALPPLQDCRACGRCKGMQKHRACTSSSLPGGVHCKHSQQQQQQQQQWVLGSQHNEQQRQQQQQLSCKQQLHQESGQASPALLAQLQGQQLCQEQQQKQQLPERQQCEQEQRSELCDLQSQMAQHGELLQPQAIYPQQQEQVLKQDWQQQTQGNALQKQLQSVSRDEQQRLQRRWQQQQAQHCLSKPVCASHLAVVLVLLAVLQAVPTAAAAAASSLQDVLLPVKPGIYNPSLVVYQGSGWLVARSTQLKWDSSGLKWIMNRAYLCQVSLQDWSVAGCYDFDPWRGAYGRQCRWGSPAWKVPWEAWGVDDTKLFRWPGRGVWAITGRRPQQPADSLYCPQPVVWRQWLVQLAEEGRPLDPEPFNHPPSEPANITWGSKPGSGRRLLLLGFPRAQDQAAEELAAAVLALDGAAPASAAAATTVPGLDKSAREHGARAVGLHLAAAAAAVDGGAHVIGSSTGSNHNSDATVYVDYGDADAGTDMRQGALNVRSRQGRRSRRRRHRAAAAGSSGGIDSSSSELQQQMSRQRRRGSLPGLANGSSNSSGSWSAGQRKYNLVRTGVYRRWKRHTRPGYTPLGVQQKQQQQQQQQRQDACTAAAAAMVAPLAAGKLANSRLGPPPAPAASASQPAARTQQQDDQQQQQQQNADQPVHVPPEAAADEPAAAEAASQSSQQGTTPGGGSGSSSGSSSSNSGSGSSSSSSGSVGGWGSLFGRPPIALAISDAKAVYGRQHSINEKNWMPFVWQDQLFVTYSLTPQHRVYRLAPDGLAEPQYESNPSAVFAPLGPAAAKLHGGPPLVLVNFTVLRSDLADPMVAAATALQGPYYLGVAHFWSAVPGSSDGRSYHHYLIKVEAQPPFRVMQLSAELPVRYNTHYKRVVFVSGIDIAMLPHRQQQQRAAAVAKVAAAAAATATAVKRRLLSSLPALPQERAAAGSRSLLVPGQSAMEQIAAAAAAAAGQAASSSSDPNAAHGADSRAAAAGSAKTDHNEQAAQQRGNVLSAFGQFAAAAAGTQRSGTGNRQQQGKSSGNADYATGQAASKHVSTLTATGSAGAAGSIHAADGIAHSQQHVSALSRFAASAAQQSPAEAAAKAPFRAISEPSQQQQQEQTGPAPGQVASVVAVQPSHAADATTAAVRDLPTRQALQQPQQQQVSALSQFAAAAAASGTSKAAVVPAQLPEQHVSALGQPAAAVATQAAGPGGSDGALVHAEQPKQQHASAVGQFEAAAASQAAGPGGSVGTMAYAQQLEPQQQQQQVSALGHFAAAVAAQHAVPDAEAARGSRESPVLVEPATVAASHKRRQRAAATSAAAPAAATQQQQQELVPHMLISYGSGDWESHVAVMTLDDVERLFMAAGATAAGGSSSSSNRPA